MNRRRLLAKINDHNNSFTKNFTTSGKNREYLTGKKTTIEQDDSDTDEQYIQQVVYS